MAEQKTTEDLRRTLFDVIEKVRTGDISTSEAVTISKLADNIIKTADLELKHAMAVSKLDKDEQGITPGPLMLANKKEDDD